MIANGVNAEARLYYWRNRAQCVARPEVHAMKIL